MRIYKITTPSFYRKFRCAGAACLNSCCYGWNIHIDKKHHQRYINASDADIKELARKHLTLTRMGKNKYSIIDFNQNGACPFLTADKLCKIHQKMGEGALSSTCANYPRTGNIWGEQLRHNMTLSCSEVARLVLFDRESMLLHQQDNLVAMGRKINVAHASFDQKNQLIHLFAWNLIGAPADDVEANLLALAQFILFLQRIDFDLAGRLAEVEAFYESLLVALQRGELTSPHSDSEQATLLKLRALIAIFEEKRSYSARTRALQQSYNVTLHYLNLTQSDNIADIQHKFTRINQQWRQLCTSSCLAEPYVLRNYLQYHLYKLYFPGHDLNLMMRNFYRIVMDYFCLKVLVTVESLHQELTENDIILLFADYHQRVHHSAPMADQLDRAINEINGGDDLSCLLLLG